MVLFEQGIVEHTFFLIHCQHAQIRPCQILICRIVIFHLGIFTTTWVSQCRLSCWSMVIQDAISVKRFLIWDSFPAFQVISPFRVFNLTTSFLMCAFFDLWLLHQIPVQLLVGCLSLERSFQFCSCVGVQLSHQSSNMITQKNSCAF